LFLVYLVKFCHGSWQNVTTLQHCICGRRLAELHALFTRANDKEEFLQRATNGNNQTSGMARGFGWGVVEELLPGTSSLIL
jgi:hypothetical protein